MKVVLVFLSFLLAFVSLNADQEKGSLLSIEQKNPSHFYFGPEFICYQLHNSIRDIDVRGKRFFWGLRIGYEFFTPKAFYAGVALVSTTSEHDFASSKNGSSISWQQADRVFGNLEIRLGYTFAPSNWMIAPFLGLGVYHVGTTDHHNKQGFKESLPYTAIGMRSLYLFHSICRLGFNLKIVKTGSASQEFKYEDGKETSYHNLWGGEVGVPLIFQIGSTQRWNIELEPYFLRLGIKDYRNVYGTRLLFGYRF